MNKIATINRAGEGEIQQILFIQKECNLAVWKQEDYIQELSNDFSVILVARERKEIVGFLAARLLYKSSSGETDKYAGRKTSEAEILNFGVLQSYRRRRIGNLLLKEFMKKAVRLLVETIWLEVRASNFPAIKFYLKNGFVETHRRKNYFSAPIEDAIVMKRSACSKQLDEQCKT